MDWEKFWQIFIAVILIIFVAFFACVIFAPKYPDCYYISMQNERFPTIFSHWNWHSDEHVYTTDDIDKLMRIYNQLPHCK